MLLDNVDHVQGTDESLSCHCYCYLAWRPYY